MKKKYWIFWGILVCLFLTGCGDHLDYNPALFKPDRASCWPCQIYVQTFHAISSFMETALNTMCANARVVLAIGLAFFLLYKMLPWVVRFSPPNLDEDVPVLLKVGLKSIIVAIFLSNSNYFYSVIGGMILQPIGDLFLKVSEFVLVSPNSMGVSTSLYNQSDSSILNGIISWMTNGSGSSANFDWRHAFSQDGVGEGLANFEKVFSRSWLPNGKALEGINTNDRMFGALPMQIQSVIWNIYSSLWTGMGLVFQLFASGYFAGFLSGLILGGCILMLLFTIPLTFVDAFVCMGMGIILLPLFMVVWVFSLKHFEGIGSKLIQLMFSAFFDILFNCIYVTFLVLVIKVYLHEKMPDLFSSDYHTSESSLRNSGLYMTTEFLIMTMLVYTVCRLSDSVGEISGHFFDGAGQASSVKKSFYALKSFVIGGAIAALRLCVGDVTALKKLGDETKNMLGEVSNDMNAHQEKDEW